VDTKFSQKDKQFGIALLIGLSLRLLAIPFSMTNEADAITRIFITQNWMSNPEIITWGVWGPLHTYLIAGILYVWNDPVYAPVVLNCLFSAAVAIPLYLLVKREWNETSALFTACFYLAYPVAFRYGLVALSEVPYIFFIALAMLQLSYARDENGNWKHALLAGIFVTLAGSLRYEAWGLTPFLGLLLWKKWKSMLVFLSAASIFPIFWMAGNYLQTGDPLYSINWAVNWNLVISLNNERLTFVEIFNRLIYYPRSLFFGLTPLAFLVCAIGIYQVIYRRGRQWIWLVPFLVLLATFTINAVNGKFSIQVRYSMGLAIFIIPFVAEWFDRQKDTRRRLILSIIVIGSMLPLSYLRYMIPWPFDFPHPVPMQVSAIPRIDPSVVQISEFEIQQAKSHQGGLLLDFSMWDETFYVALMSRKHPSNIYIMPGEVNEPLVPLELDTFFMNNPSGIVLLTENPRFMQINPSEDLVSFIGYEKTLSVKALGEVEGTRFYNYAVNP
jgi:hypothetical protein